MAVADAALPSPAQAPNDGYFSLVRGGPTFQVLRRVRLADERLRLLHRRILAVVLILWLPPAVLAALEGGLAGPGRMMPFLQDIGFQLRFLVVVPLLIGAEVVVHERLEPLIAQFRIRNLVPADQIGRFADALARAERLRNSNLAELVLLAIVAVVGVVFTMKRYAAFGGDTWYASPTGSGRLSLAGLWLVLISVPLLQFLLLRWYFRLGIWALFLWRVSRIELDLHATHPDKAGGLGFLSYSLIAFAPLAMAHGMLFAGTMADRIFYAGAKLPEFQMQAVAGGLFLVAMFAGPLTVFAWPLAKVKRRGVRSYGALGQDYVRDFQAKWLSGTQPAGEPLIGSADIQSLADLGNSFGAAEQMRIVPVRAVPLMVFVAAYLAPMVPLLLTVMSLEALVKQLMGVVF